MVTRRIARNGMRGRKKVSLLLILVLTFTFLFTTSINILETSMQETRIRQREQLYGTWQAAYLGVDAKMREQFLAETDVTEAVTSYLLGRDKDLGTVGTISPEMAQMGKLVVKQGRLPEGPQEIVLEESVADRLGLSDPLGEMVTLNMETILVSEDKQAYLSGQYLDVSEDLEPGERKPISSFRRQIADKEHISDDLLLAVNREYAFLDETRYITPEEIEANGILYAQNLILTREYKITGIVQSFSGFWDTGAFPVAEIFAGQQEAEILTEAIRGNQIIDLTDFSFDANIFARSDTLGGALYDSLKDTYLTAEDAAAGNERVISFRRNTYAYPSSEADSSQSLVYLMMAVIFIVSFCAILQIFLTQMKQRTRKIALLKSIGTTDGQVCAILIWEGGYLLCAALPAGVLLGFLTGYGMIRLVNAWFHMELVFFVRPEMILTGILAGCAALFAGMLVPMRKAVHVPLVGEIAVTSARRRKSARHSDKKTKARRPLTYGRIASMHHRQNFRRHFLTGAVTCIATILVFVSLYLGYEAFGTYRQTVVEANRPNYELYAMHGFERNDVKAVFEEVEEIDPKAEVSSYTRLRQVLFKYEGMDESPLIAGFKDYLPEERYAGFVASEPTMEEQLLLEADPEDYKELYGSISTSLYGVEDSVYDSVKAMVTAGEVDDNEFIRGETVILAVPRYRSPSATPEKEGIVPETVTDDEMFHYVLTELGGFELTFDADEAGYYETDESVKPGDELTIYKRREFISSSGGPPQYDSYKVKVGGIIYDTGDETVYPFLTEHAGITVIGSKSFMGIISRDTLYNPVKRGSDFSEDEEQFAFALSQCPTIFGETHMNIYTSDRANAVEPAAKMAQIGKENGMTLVNYNEENWNLYFRALNNALILGILGGTSLLIALLILWNIHMSAFEQERKRIGILQALGVTNQKIALDYWKTGVKNAALSLAVSHAVLFGVLMLVQGGILHLKYYPWIAHILIATACFLLIVLVHSGPARELKKYMPTENIAS